ncbi:MAG: Xaa-Pro peptidase family protein, partial [Spirochaetaceae bacterium]|nr:Xaa-Pro peptidase family protein [Spirochaetaceae bacterium]
DESGIDLLLATTRHDVRYLSGGYFYHFHALSTRMGRTQYLPLVGIPRGRADDAFYVGRAEERGQIEAEGLWIPNFVEALRGTKSTAASAAAWIRRSGGASRRIGVEMPFIPADAYLALREALPDAVLVDATPLLDELRAVKSEAELAILRGVYSRVADSIGSTFRASGPGETTRDIAARVELEMAKRGVSFIFALVCAGPGYLRAPSGARWEKGRALHIDAGGTDRDYVADICRMGCMGEPDALSRDLYDACIAVQDQARKAIRAGVRRWEVMESGLEAARCSGFPESARFVVHGIGMVPYEEPVFRPDDPRLLEAGMVLSVETDFRHPEVGHVKIEDAVIVREEGCEGLGDRGREWQILSP